MREKEIQKQDLKLLFSRDTGNIEKRISIIIPTFNKRNFLKPCLFSLFNQTADKEDYEIIVVDDGSSDGTFELMQKTNPICSFRYYYFNRSDPNINRSGPARNIGISQSNGEIVLFIDSDMISSPDLIKSHIEAHKKKRNAVIGIRKYLYERDSEFLKSNPEVVNDFKKCLNFQNIIDEREPIFNLFNDNFNEMIAPWDLFYTCNASVRKEDIEQVGGFDDCFIYWGTEDKDLAYRLFKDGINIKLERKAVAFHLYHSNFSISDFSQYKKIRYNKEKFYKKYLDPTIKLIYEHIFTENPFNEIKVGYLCNNNCLYCSSLNKKIYMNKSLKEIKDELLEIKSRGNSEIILTGGEPTLRKDIRTILDIITKLGFKSLVLRTNGRFFKDRSNYDQFFSPFNLDFYFEIILFSHRPKIHDKITQVSGSFEETLNGIINLLQYKQKVKIIIPITKLNYKSVLKTVNYFINIGIYNIQILYPVQVNDSSSFMVNHCNITRFKELYPEFSKVVPYIYDTFNVIESLKNIVKITAKLHWIKEIYYDPSNKSSNFIVIRRQ